jgi:hypothetical protein
VKADSAEGVYVREPWVAADARVARRVDGPVLAVHFIAAVAHLFVIPNDLLHLLLFFHLYLVYRLA